ncbi:MAG: patatin-like phospholipase family protein, partial [Chthoniobacteraceae bacterium]
VDDRKPTLARESIVGLALSGGGVRSATFALGVLQTLARKGKLRHIDYLATVSGGGFAGGFLGRLFTRKGIADLADPCARAEEILSSNDSGPLRWLRAQANYLFANGKDDFLIAAAVYFRNVFTVHLVIGAMLVAVFGMLVGITRLAVFQTLIPQLPPLPAWHDLNPLPSLWWWLPLAMLALVILPMKLGYWLAPKPRSYRSHPPYPLAAWLILIIGASLTLSLPGAGKLVGGAMLLALALAWIWQEIARRGLSEADVKACRAEGPLVRNRLTRGLGEALALFLMLLLWVGLDSLARTIAETRHLTAMISALLALSPTLHMLKSRAVTILPKSDTPGSFTTEKVIGFVLAFALLFLADVIAHTLFLSLEPKWAWGGLLIALAFSVVIGRAFDLLNYTSLSETYASRLKRTFLGASNPERTQGADSSGADVQIVHPGDDLPHAKYRPEQHGGPLHLISVCVNETVDHASQREIRERKGLPMTLGSFGVSVGLRYFAQWSPTIDEPWWLGARRHFEGIDHDGANSPSLEPLRLNCDPNTFHPLGRRDDRPAVVQSLSLGDWMAVSGAAFSTGNGRATSPLLALFMGICNVRLGFWWDSGITATERPGRFPANVWRRIKELPGAFFRAQQLLLSEWRGRFDGPSREFWNLSDGGHFDNTSTYELIRRKVPFIICTDATGDPDYSFADMANLVRLVRIDFNAEIEWQTNPSALKLPNLAAAWIDLNQVGTIDDIKGNPSGKGPGTKHAAIARVCYKDGSPDSWLLLIKASLTGNETLDIRQYAGSHQNFPQDPTSDQTYDDEQWESYRKLGQKASDLVIK